MAASRAAINRNSGGGRDIGAQLTIWAAVGPGYPATFSCLVSRICWWALRTRMLHTHSDLDSCLARLTNPRPSPLPTRIGFTMRRVSPERNLLDLGIRVPGSQGAYKT